MLNRNPWIFIPSNPPVALGTGILDLAGVYSILKDTVEHSTLEVAGADALKASYDYLKTLGAE